jgi:hypothetical protein
METKKNYKESIKKLLLSRDTFDKLLAKVTKRKREKTQVNKIRDEKRYITTNIKEIQRIIRKYFGNIPIN